MTRIELRDFGSCPNWKTADQRFREAMESEEAHSEVGPRAISVGASLTTAENWDAWMNVRPRPVFPNKWPGVHP